MKYCVLLFVAAVCAVVLPSDVAARAVASPSLRVPLEAAKRHLARREAAEDDDSLADILASDDLPQMLARYGLTMEEIDEAINSDDDIEPEDRQAVKGIIITVLATLDEINSLLDSSLFNGSLFDSSLFEDSSEEVKSKEDSSQEM